MSLVKDERRRQVYSLHVRGYSKTAIAKMVGSSPVTVSKDIAFHEMELKQIKSKIDPENYLTEVRSEYDELRAESWKGFEKADRDMDRTRYLNTLIRLRESETKVLHDMGVLDKAPQVVEHMHKVSGSVTAEIKDSRLDALAAILLAGEMGVTPEHALSMRGMDPVYIEDAEYEELPMRDPVMEPVLESNPESE